MNGLYLAASGAASLVRALDVTAANLANVGTPGFRRFEVVMRAVRAGASPYEYAETAPQARIDMAQGTLKATGFPLDVAITGPAFMVVATENGEAYTRNGQLQMAPDGTLLAAGNPLIDAAGAPIVLPSGRISIGSDGSISVDGLPLDRIRLADPDGRTLVPIGAGLYRTVGGEPLGPAAGGSSLNQGFLEKSRGDAVTGTVAMITIMRGYESAMRAIQVIDRNRDRAIQTFTLQA